MRANKAAAIVLRKQGKSYLQISRQLGVPKSTLSYWLKDIPLSTQVRERIHRRGRKKSIQALITRNKLQTTRAKEKAADIQNLAMQEAHMLKKSQLFLLGIALYWAEGYKQWDGKGVWKCVDFTNSDAEMIRLMMRFFREICGVQEHCFKIQIMLHPGAKIQDALNHWKKITGVPEEQFFKPSIVLSKASKKKVTRFLEYGTVHVRIYSVDLLNRLIGWMNAIKTIGA